MHEGLGGVEPTLTDANLVLGHLGARGLVGGSLAIDNDAAARATEERIARPLAIDITAAAAGIVRIAVANMARAIRAISTEPIRSERRRAQLRLWKCWWQRAIKPVVSARRAPLRAISHG